MAGLFLEILAQVTGFLSTIIFPISTLLAIILRKMFGKTNVEAPMETPSLSSKPKDGIPPWLKDVAEVNEPFLASPIMENQTNINTSQVQVPKFEDEKKTSSLAREVFFVKEEEPKVEEKPRPKQKTKPIKEEKKEKLTLEDLLTKKITNARFNILLKLPPKAKLRVLGRDWEVDTEKTFIEISTIPQTISTPNESSGIEEEIESPEEPWRLPEKKEREEEEELEEEDWETEEYG